MNRISITCDRKGPLWRVAVWKGKALQDLYVDRIDKPDFTGAVVAGKVARVIGSQKAAYVDCGLDEMVFVEDKNKFHAGDRVTLVIKTSARQGKAYSGRLETQSDHEMGIVEPPPKPWQRAIMDLSKNKVASISFANREDYNECKKLMEHSDISPILSSEPVHIDLDDIIDGLLNPVVTLPGGASLVIETTEALTAIDVNGGSSNNPLGLNLVAIAEAARQIRLRNVSGIIMMDCMKMHQRTNTNTAINALKKATEDDPAKVNIFGMTRLGLIEFTRTRRLRSLEEIINER
ncbi:MAG: ribonuclease E/G [Alphaproteobacteria bacterium]|nr:ribonuclease E/G [Alphaproteobacteria bacterium]